MSIAPFFLCYLYLSVLLIFTLIIQLHWFVIPAE